MGNVELLIGLHNTTSVQRLVDFAKLVFSSSVTRYLVVTKVGGVAAQSGVPEVNKLAIKSGKSFSVLPDLKDAIELLRPSAVYLVTAQSSETLDPVALKRERSLVVFNGVDSGFGKVDSSLGKPVRLEGLEVDVGPVAAGALLLYCNKWLVQS
ncbi:exonuclease [Sulfodiicoccus acidiphilus]|uniref:Exonuclease n=1 Tax=Sulfodiicoccus acidiphilus TaxID=1670455 RepID=A0A348B3S7_9CREN|nr:exonuclease [Sulfodiicoccus acidiphilus]GGT88668.1 exonuclease [Sulfodiicoccus acidiphilus]